MRYPKRWLALWTWLCLGWIITYVHAIADTIIEDEVLVMVEGVEGQSAALPCDLYPTDPQDKVNLILWYKDEEKDPIYSYDARLTVFDSDRHHLKDLRLKGRIMFTPSPGAPIPHTLTVNRLSASDRGKYRCRVDFMRAQSSTVGAELRVVAPVDSLIITDADRNPVPPVLTPIPEGGTLNITCTARGGRPQPKVSWWFGESVIDDSWVSEKSGIVTNTLVLSPLNRAHAHSVLVCKAATAAVAVTTATVTIDMYLRPLSVELTGTAVSGSVRAGDVLDLTCTARGSRPQPVITWYKGANLIHTENTHKNYPKAVTGVGGVSQVRERVTRRDNGARVTCRVTNPTLPRHTLQEHIVINVTYPPEVELRLGAPLKGSVVNENSNLYLTCHVDSNPPPHKLIFMHQGETVSPDKGGRVLINGNNLVMNKVKRNQAGEYSCTAINSQGKATSAPLNVTVLYAPVCATSKDVWAEPGNTIRTQCNVQASPIKPLWFSWVWVTNSYSRRVIPSHVQSEGSSSTVNFTVPRDNMTEIGSNNQLGVLQCWAENTVGRQEAPCEISVRKPSAPAAPKNCSISGAGREVVTVTCQPGDASTTMPQTYRLQVYEAHKRKLIHNVTSIRPRFIVRGLTSGQDYVVYVSSHTSFGRSPYHLVEAFTFKAAENRMRSEDSMPSLSTIIMFVGGVAAIVAIVVIFVITVRIKMRKTSHKCVRRTATATDSVIPKKPSQEGISAASSSAISAAIQDSITPKKDSLHPKDAIQLHPKDAIQLQSSHTRETSAPHAREMSSSHAREMSSSHAREMSSSHTRDTPGSHTHHSSHSSYTPHNKDAIPLQPIIRQPSKTLQPIIKENGRSEKSSQGRTVLFVEPPKAQSGILVNKGEVPRNAYDVYPGRRRQMKDPNGDVKHIPYTHRGSYSDMRTSYAPEHENIPRYNELELPPRRYRSLDDGEECRGITNRQYPPNSAVQREVEYYPSYGSSMVTSPPYSARELPCRELPRDYSRDSRREMREHRVLARESSRDHQREMMRERDRDRDRDRDPGHVFAFPSRISSGDYDQPTSIMKRSPSMSASVGRHYDKPMRRSEGGTYRSLPRPSKSRGEAEEEVLRKYRSLDRRFDLPFSGSLPRPEPEPCEEQPPPPPPQQHQRRYSGSPRLRFADEKHFHLYHDKEKKQSGVNDRDESFI